MSLKHLSLKQQIKKELREDIQEEFNQLYELIKDYINKVEEERKTQL